MLRARSTAGFLMASLAMGVCASVAGGGLFVVFGTTSTRSSYGDRPTRTIRPKVERSRQACPVRATRPPDWIGNTMPPFDVNALFAAPPPEENSAPLYLDALFEFGKEVAICFPEGPDS